MNRHVAASLVWAALTLSMAGKAAAVAIGRGDRYDEAIVGVFAIGAACVLLSKTLERARDAYYAGGGRPRYWRGRRLI